jgi:hypothetical protein
VKKMKTKEEKEESTTKVPSAKSSILKKGFFAAALVTAILLVAALVVPLNAVLPPPYLKGTIAVYSAPEGATISLETPDGAIVGPTVTTPRTFTEITPGTCTVTLSLDGFYDWSKSVQVNGGRTTQVHATLTPIYTPKATGAISVSSEPSGATIELITPAGLFVGTSEITPYTFNKIGTGTSTVTLTLDGYHKWSANVYVREGATAYVDATLTPIQTTGSIHVTSSPSGANIGLDGQWYGMLRTTPDIITNIPQGHHTLELALDGYRDWYTNVQVIAGETKYVHATLTPIQATGAIKITSEPEGATISLETPHGMFVGPSVITPHTYQRVEPGTCTVTLTLDGYPDWTENVTVNAGETTVVHATLDWLTPP